MVVVNLSRMRKSNGSPSLPYFCMLVMYDVIKALLHFRAFVRSSCMTSSEISFTSVLLYAPHAWHHQRFPSLPCFCMLLMYAIKVPLHFRTSVCSSCMASSEISFTSVLLMTLSKLLYYGFRRRFIEHSLLF
jgi:hypothetical protein